MTKFSQKSLPYKVLKYIRKNSLIESGDTIIVALSGGPDSVCLFDLLLKLRDELNIKLFACHYDHRMRGEESYNDAVFVETLCKERGVKCIIGRAEGENLYKNEEEAREGRYTFFKKILKEGRGEAKIAIAHNLNDQAETLLLRLTRGTGLFGLKGIPSRRENFIRPLLSSTKKEIEDYLRKENLKCRIDSTNKEIRFDRNYLRIKVIPLFEKLNPNFIETLGGMIELLEDDYRLLDDLSEKSYKKILVKETKDEIVIDQKKWLRLPSSLQRLTLRSTISKISTLVDITQKQLLEVYNVAQKGEGKKYKLLPHSLRVELLSGKIIVSRNKS